jgi:hypothetical protein
MSSVGFGGTKNIGNSSGTPSAGPLTSSSWTISGSELGIFVKIAIADSSHAVTVTAVTWSLGSGTPVEVFTHRIADTYASIWAIPAPTAGSGTYSVTFSGSVQYQIAANYFTGCHQTTPGTDGAFADGATPDPLSVTPANLTANDAAVGIGANANGGDAPVIQQTETYNDNSTNVNASAGYHLGTGAITCRWNNGAGTSAVDALIAVRIAAASGGGGETITMDKWCPQATPNRRRVATAIASGTIGIRNT